VLLSYSYYVALISMCDLDVLCGSMYVAFVGFVCKKDNGFRVPHFLLFPKGGGVRLRVCNALVVGHCTDVCVY